MIKWLMNNELERIWNTAAVVVFKVISRYLPGENEETHESQPVFWPIFKPVTSMI
jgi:hypothetical protein